MAIVPSRFSVTDEPVKINSAQTDRVSGASVLFTNRGPNSVFVGGDDSVTSATGYEVLLNETVALDLDAPTQSSGTEEVWLTTAVGETATVHVLERGV